MNSDRFILDWSIWVIFVFIAINWRCRHHLWKNMSVVHVLNSICRYLLPRISRISQRNSLSSFLISYSQFAKDFNRIWKSPFELVLIVHESAVESVKSKFETTDERSMKFVWIKWFNVSFKRKIIFPEGWISHERMIHFSVWLYLALNGFWLNVKHWFFSPRNFTNLFLYLVKCFSNSFTLFHSLFDASFLIKDWCI